MAAMSHSVDARWSPSSLEYPNMPQQPILAGLIGNRKKTMITAPFHITMFLLNLYTMPKQFSNTTYKYFPTYMKLVI